MATSKSTSTPPASKATPPTEPTPAQLAKAALKRLAEHRLEPTPDNYRQAYEAESGVVSPLADKPADKPAASEDASQNNDDGERWSALITRILRGAERGGRQWTAARKKDSLKRVLDGSKSSANRLHQRLSQLVGSWDSDTLDNATLEGDDAGDIATTSTTTATESTAPVQASSPVPDTADEATSASPDRAQASAWPQLALHAIDQLTDTIEAALPPQQAQSTEANQAMRSALDQGRDTATPPAQYAQIKTEISQACEQARRIVEHRHHLIDQLMDLCLSLTDSLTDLSEDDSWVQGQCQAMRHQLDEGLNSRGVRHIQQLLEQTREKQLALKKEREAARQALKQLIHQMLQEIAELGMTTDRFQSNLGRYADTIGQADSLESLTGVVRELVEESRAVQGVVQQTQTRLNDEHARASELSERVRQLEDEIRKLSDEVSTDPLTQIANRRGMMRAFEVEQAKMERDGTTLAVGLLDVDNFKKLNDTLGHQTGDEALKFLSRRVGECLRPVDVVARYGGEEFVVMLPATGLEEAQQTLTRLQRTLSAEFFEHEDKKVFITFSAGVTLYRKGEPIEATLDRSDVALYEAKRTGKNRTCMN
ncbi:MAG: GGDEF domain-containing protein [Aquabacterium sp.]|uniref:GGDEF domain-containing protein n=1 Tax=Aquabacterium sp. TaxID=1872578 RepID=UPI001229ACCD|nr:GGDEF domain-containing protein [Aquabacterium sp.]TAK92878.1 MAG: GGDEF domain-containing protein [Aquabacterium sp.]